MESFSRWGADFRNRFRKEKYARPVAEYIQSKILSTICKVANQYGSRHHIFNN